MKQQVLAIDAVVKCYDTPFSFGREAIIGSLVGAEVEGSDTGAFAGEEVSLVTNAAGARAQVTLPKYVKSLVAASYIEAY